MPRDLASIRTSLLGDCGIRLTLSHTVEECRVAQGLMPAGVASLNDAVRCLACELVEEASVLAEKARQFLSASLLVQETPRHYFPGVSEAQRLVYLSLASALIPADPFIPPSPAIVGHLLRAAPRLLDGYRLFFVICGSSNRLTSSTEISLSGLLRIQHPDRFANFLANSPLIPQSETVICAFLSRYARVCLGLTDGLATPVDLLTAFYAADTARGRTLDRARVSSLLNASLQ